MERLRILATDPSTSPPVKKKVQALFRGWSEELQGKRGYERLASLQKQVPQRVRKERRPPPKYLSNDPQDFDDVDDDDEPRSGTTTPGGSNPAPGISGRRGKPVEDPHASYMFGAHSKNTYNADDHSGVSGSFLGGRSRANSFTENGHSGSSGSYLKASSNKKKVPKKPAGPSLPPVNLVKERPKIQQTLAEASSAATNLMNALQLINWERELSTDNKRATECFNKCRRLRKNILRYIHSIESEEFIGALIHANEELIQALQKYDKMSQAPDDDSDSDYENDDWRAESRRRGNANESDSELSSNGSDRRPPTGKGKKSYSDDDEEDEDDDNPFGDSNAVSESTYKNY